MVCATWPLSRKLACSPTGDAGGLAQVTLTPWMDLFKQATYQQGPDHRVLAVQAGVNFGCEAWLPHDFTDHPWLVFKQDNRILKVVPVTHLEQRRLLHTLADGLRGTDWHLQWLHTLGSPHTPLWLRHSARMRRCLAAVHTLPQLSTWRDRACASPLVQT